MEIFGWMGLETGDTFCHCQVSVILTSDAMKANIHSIPKWKQDEWSDYGSQIFGLRSM